MIGQIVKKVFGTRNERLLKNYRKVVQQINALEPSMKALSDEALKAKTAEFKKRLQAGESLEKLLPEAFAVVREASQRVLGMRHFDVQLIGAMVLNEGKVAEMRTGEGKTLMSTLAVYLNSLPGKGVHLVTVNDYLAERDANWMKPLYEFLGLSVGVNLTGLSLEDKQAAYNADVTYGTNNEFGFDYLRDNMVYDLNQRVQRELNFCIVDEVDSILIDEARTPLIISGQVEESSEMYADINAIIPKLILQKVEENPLEEQEIKEEQRGDYTVDEKTKQAQLTEQGHEKVEALLREKGLLSEGDSLYDMKNLSLMHYINACLRAHSLFQRDVDYIVKNNQVIIVDEHTGRLMDGRRWSDGLHQAVEAKEGVPIQLENQTLATITFQNFFRLYDKLSGMTGTADTEAFELQKIYGLEVAVIPTNRPLVRKDMHDQVYIAQKAKYKAIVEEVKKAKERGQPVLVGTASVESSELVSHLLNKAGIEHQVLNAKQHEREARVIAQAGVPGTVTIATNMAGRGTDIVLGGNLSAEIEMLDNPTEEQVTKLRAQWQQRHDKVIEAGGLFVLGTERHESRRIDNQLRGRAGRQGDPGRSQFFLSMEDNLMRIFAGERVLGMMKRLGVKEDDVIEHRWITNAIEKAQKRVEGMNFDMRKSLLEYDDVANDQRKVVYQQRLKLLESDQDLADTLKEMRAEVVQHMLAQFIPPQSMIEEWNVSGLEDRLREEFDLHLPVQQWLDQEPSLQEEQLQERIVDAVQKAMDEKESQVGSEQLRKLERQLMLQLLDQHWRDHLAAMDYLRQGIHLRGYAQKNPAQEYKRESFNLFTAMWDAVKYELIATLSRVRVGEPDSLDQAQPSLVNVNYQHTSLEGLPETADIETAQGESDEEASVQPFVRETPKVGRNEPCPCGSGKKYKQCHGQLN